MAYIEYLYEGRHHRLNLELAIVTIGRSVDCTVQIENDPETSRIHCTILQTLSGGHLLRDENASNGTYVNGVRVADEPVELADGDEIRVGRIHFTYRREAEEMGRTAMLFSEVEGRMREGAGFHTIFTEIVKPTRKGK